MKERNLRTGSKQFLLRRLVLVVSIIFMSAPAAFAQDNADINGANAVSGTKGDANRLFLRANLLRWATLTPDLGVEWRIDNNWAVLVNGSWTTWSWNDKARRYALREIAPEVRYYLGKETGGYFGASYKVGSFNYKFSQTGKQGDIMGGGITGGYVLKLNNTLSLDFSLGLGYIHAGYDEYVLMDGVRMRSGEGSKNWWGPTNIGVSLVWNVFNK